MRWSAPLVILLLLVGCASPAQDTSTPEASGTTASAPASTTTAAAATSGPRAWLLEVTGNVRRDGPAPSQTTTCTTDDFRGYRINAANATILMRPADARLGVLVHDGVTVDPEYRPAGAFGTRRFTPIEDGVSFTFHGGHPGLMLGISLLGNDTSIKVGGLERAAGHMSTQVAERQWTDPEGRPQRLSGEVTWRIVGPYAVKPL